jgi:hypothetical protein
VIAGSAEYRADRDGGEASCSSAPPVDDTAQIPSGESSAAIGSSPARSAPTVVKVFDAVTVTVQ